MVSDSCITFYANCCLLIKPWCEQSANTRCDSTCFIFGGSKSADLLFKCSVISSSSCACLPDFARLHNIWWHTEVCEPNRSTHWRRDSTTNISSGINLRWLLLSHVLCKRMRATIWFAFTCIPVGTECFICFLGKSKQHLSPVRGSSPQLLRIHWRRLDTNATWTISTNWLEWHLGSSNCRMIGCASKFMLPLL